MRSKQGFWLSLVLSLAMVLLSFAARAEFPEKPITLIVPYGAGGPTDQHLRVVAEEARKILGQTIVIENRQGANGSTGATALTRAPADGYTLAILPASIYREPFITKVPYDPNLSFSYILLMTDYTFGVVVKSDAPWKNWAEFAADAAKRPGQLSTGVGGGPIGTPSLTLEEAAEAAHIKLNIVPFKGDADVSSAVLGGHIDAAVLSGVATAYIKAGKMRYLALLTEKRVKSYPELKTLKEQGVDSWIESPYGLAGPKGMDPARVKIIHDAFKKALESPASVRVMEQLNQQINYKNPDDYRKYAQQVYARERIRMAKLRERGQLN